MQHAPSSWRTGAKTRRRDWLRVRDWLMFALGCCVYALVLLSLDGPWSWPVTIACGLVGGACIGGLLRGA